MVYTQRSLTAEERRVKENLIGDVPTWHKWGPYLSERSWGTVREDYSEHGNAWDYITFDASRSKAYRWGEDGIGGICDRYQVLCISFAFWNEKDPILKERLYGLSTSQGNHGEDVKEYYYYLDNTPSHSYMKYLYKYPQAEYPYEQLLKENAGRGPEEREFELIDTGVFNENRYFDIVIEYAKPQAEELVIRLEAFNRGPEEAALHILPQIWFRNTWTWENPSGKQPLITKGTSNDKYDCLIADDSETEPVSLLNFPYRLGKRYFYAEKGSMQLFTNNDTNNEKLFGKSNSTPYVKDAFHRYIIDKENCINPENKGSKACFHFNALKIPPGGSKTIRLLLTNIPYDDPLNNIDIFINKRKEEADEFYNEAVHPKNASEDEKMIQRQAISGMLWSKQIYLFNVSRWFKGDDPDNPPPESRKHIRNVHWKHLISKRILSMPDKWEYPWFAAWDLAFQCLTFGLVDMEFAKEQLWLLLFDQFQHPNGQIPAYEWEFSELNPPVQAWAAWRLYKMDMERNGKKDRSFLKKCFHKLVINFVWWVNRVDSQGNNVFEGGFLGLDNITVIDRSEAIPGGGRLEQSDGTGWMGMFCLMLMRMALELAGDDPDYEVMATKFFEHYVYIAAALHYSENRAVQIWDEKDGFFYDVLSYPDGSNQQIFVRSLVGIIPLYAIDYLTEEDLKNFSEFSANFHWFFKNRKDLVEHCITKFDRDGKSYYLLALMKKDHLKRVLSRVWDPSEFRSKYGLRSLSKFHEQNPYDLLGNTVMYDPGESRFRVKGGNSNWRGPIWFPTSFLLIEALNNLYHIVGPEFKIATLQGEEEANLQEVANYFSQALIDIFRLDSEGKRPVNGDYEKFQTDPYFKNLILFHEHFHGDTGRGLGASHQTGWTGLVANLIDEWI
ncbi:MAG: glucosidase [Simkaniaceae bacterium]